MNPGPRKVKPVLLTIAPTCFVKYIFIIFNYVYRFVGYVHMSTGALEGWGGYDSPGVGVTGGASFSVWVSGNQTQVLYNISVHL